MKGEEREDSITNVLVWNVFRSFDQVGSESVDHHRRRQRVRCVMENMNRLVV